MDTETVKNKINIKINPKKVIIPVIAVLAVLIVAINSFVVVEAGHTGVVVTLGAVNEGVLQEGMHLKAPFVQDVVKIDNRIQKLEVKTEAFSKDLQSVDTVLAINYRVDTRHQPRADFRRSDRGTQRKAQRHRLVCDGRQHHRL